ncbi:MAG: hypothetical protein JO116_01990 [Planctomycetaceae bacterium]|nr:hypothetical protein [Planctomycetaceae bacterium]MBV8554306.1 hypothetical protein [Planctomycetaceae bacterium]
MSLSLLDKKASVTESSRGNGRAIAPELASAGADVVISCSHAGGELAEGVCRSICDMSRKAESPVAAFITGHVLDINGGLVIKQAR